MRRSLDGTFREKDFEISRAGVRFGVKPGMGRSASGGDLAILGDADLWLPAGAARAGDARPASGCVLACGAARRGATARTSGAAHVNACASCTEGASVLTLHALWGGPPPSNGHSRHNSLGGDGELSPGTPVRLRANPS